jgi:rhomboid protease GluP
MSADRDGSSFINRLQLSPLTWFISALNIGMFLLTWIRDGSSGFSIDSETLDAYGATSRFMIQHGEPWRLLTAIFLHANWIHLGVNVFFMFSWCSAVERHSGSAWFAFAYLTTGIGAYAVSALSRPYGSVGASGAGFGIIAVYLALLYRREGSWDNFISNPAARSILTQGGAWIIAGLFFIKGLDNAAHLGGIAFGFPCGLVLGARQGRRRPAWIAALAAYILVWVALVVVACIPGMGFGSGG